MARENPAYARIREEYATKYLIAREEADLRRAEIHLAIPEVPRVLATNSSINIQDKHTLIP